MTRDGTTADIPSDWYAESFGALYPLVYAHRDAASAETEALFAARCLQLRPGDRVLDLACGNGRHLFHLVSIAQGAVGLDYSPELLLLARETLGGRAGLVRGDMRAIPFAATFDAVFNFFTSFGYFETDEENAAVVQTLAAALAPRGRFFMDYLNPDHVEATLVPRSEREIDGHHIVEERWIDTRQRRVNKRTVVRGPRGGERVFGESVRLYSYPQMQRLLETAGLMITASFGDYTGVDRGPEQPRMILAGHKVGGHA